MKTLNHTETQGLLQDTKRELAEAVRRHGEAVAAGDDSSASRTAVATIKQRIADLKAALPVVQAQDEAREAALRAEAELARQSAQNDLRNAHLAAALKVDEALATLGKAYDELIATDRNVGGHSKDTSRCIRSRELLLRAAIHATSPALARDLRLQRPRASSDIRPFAEHEALMITEFTQ